MELLEEKAFERWWSNYCLKDNLGIRERGVAIDAYDAGINELMTVKQYLEKDNEVLNTRIDEVVEELDKAKLIIKKLSWDIRNRSYNPVKDLDEAEAFLKETERYE